MPSLLQSAQLKPDVTITSADSDNDIYDSDDDRFELLCGTVVNSNRTHTLLGLDARLKHLLNWDVG